MKIRFLFTMLFTAILTINCIAQGTWIQKADFAGSARNAAIGFSIKDKGYLGTGYNSTSSQKDFWEYSPASNTWTQKADIGTTLRLYAVAFSIDNAGYVCAGCSSTVYFGDVWKYDPSNNTWTQKVNYPGSGKSRAVGFVINGKGYVGTGYDATANYKDFYEFDPTANTWTKKADFPGVARRSATGFSIGDRGYLGTGWDGVSPSSTMYKDFYEYYPTTDTWTKKADFGGLAVNASIGFSIGTDGYIGTGWNTDYSLELWRYNSLYDSWTKDADFTGAARYGAIAFTVNLKAYVGTGYTAGARVKDFYEYTPALKQPELMAHLITKNSARISTPGTYPFSNPANIVIFLKEGTGLVTNPQNYTTYISSEDWITKGTQLGSSGYYCVYKGGADEFEIINLKPNTTYTVQAFAYGGKAGYEEYLLTTNSLNPITFTTEEDFSKWEQKADLPSAERNAAASFSIGSKGYICTGYQSEGNLLQDMWEYDIITETWSQKADFAGVARIYASSFAIGKKGYVGIGSDGATNYYKDFWAYDQESNTWLQVADFGGGYRARAISGASDTCGYVGTGMDDTGILYKDFWMYSPKVNSWITRADFPGAARWSAAAFSLSYGLFAGTGWNNAAIMYNDFYRYVFSSDSWEQIDDFPGSPRNACVAFSFGCNDGGIVGSGYDVNYLNDFYAFVNNKWSKVTDLPGETRYGAVAFNIGPYGFVGTGTKSGYDRLKDFYQYTPDSAQVSFINFTNITSNSVTINWLSGNGNNRAVFLEEGTGGYRSKDGDTFVASADWSVKGTELYPGLGNYCIYNGAGNSVTVTNLSPNTTYTVNALELQAGTNYYYVGETTDNPNSFKTDFPVSTNLAEQNSFKIYPNPSDGIFNFENLEKTEKTAFEVYDMNGKRMLEGKISHNSQVDLSILSNGAYMIQVNNGGKILSQQIIKK